MHKWVYTGIGTVVIAALLITLSGTIGGTASVAAQQSGNTATIEKTSLNSTIETTGTVVPAQSIYLTFGTGGKIKELKAQLGATVKTGDVLAMLDTADLEYQVKLAEQQLAAQQASYDSLIAPPTDKEISQAKATLASAKQQLVSAQVSEKTSSDSITSSCSDVDSKKLTLERAQTTYNDFVKDGFGSDANFQPDPDADAATKLRDAQRAYDVAVANCNTAKLNSDVSLKVASAQASVDQAQAALDSLIAGASKQDIDASKAQVEQKKLQLENARKNLDNAKVVAPYNGVGGFPGGAGGSFPGVGGQTGTGSGNFQIPPNFTPPAGMQLPPGAQSTMQASPLWNLTISCSMSKLEGFSVPGFMSDHRDRHPESQGYPKAMWQYPQGQYAHSVIRSHDGRFAGRGWHSARP